MQLDLFTPSLQPCSTCCNLGAAIDSGIQYCWGAMTWRWATDKVDGCPYRDRPLRQIERSNAATIDALRDLLEHPRHSIDAKGCVWLQAELRREERAMRRAA